MQVACRRDPRSGLRPRPVVLSPAGPLQEAEQPGPGSLRPSGQDRAFSQALTGIDLGLNAVKATVLTSINVRACNPAKDPSP